MDNSKQTLASWPDRDLVVAFKGGVPEAYDEMYRRYNDRVQMVCRRMLGSSEDAREASQETFLKAYVALPRFNGQYKLGAWLSRIATNVCVDHIRRRARGATLTPLNESHEGEHLDLGPEDVVIRDIPALRTLDELQPLHAKALELRNLQGMSHKEIADQLGMSPMQVKALLHRARASFKRAWENASGWAVAPLVGLRHMLHSSRDVSSIGAQLPAWSQAAAPLLVEKVAASAMVVAIALSGAGSPATTTPVPAPVPDAPFATAELDTALEVPQATARNRTADARPTLTAEVDSLLEKVRETAKRETSKDRPREKDDDDGGGGVAPTDPERASQKLVKNVQDALPDL
jgi:RNA polymerase sigma-70 factor (ECF subfamily)